MDVRIVFVAGALFLTGCVFVDYELATPSQVRASWASPNALATLKYSSDCVPIIFGLGLGTASAEAAARKGGIAKVHQVGMSRNYFLLAGAECVHVRGEFSQALLDDYHRALRASSNFYERKDGPR